MNSTVLFVSWCRPDLIRPRTIQVGRVAKGLSGRGWKIPLICSTFENEWDLFDRELGRLYESSFLSVTPLMDVSSHSATTRKWTDQGANGPRWMPNISTPPWVEAVGKKVLRWATWRFQPLVVSFAQPWESHLALLMAKKRLPRLRWIAHFSDPWARSPYLDDQPFDVRQAAAANERAVIEAADAVVFVTELTAELTMKNYPAEWRRKVRVIPHSTDLALMRAVNTANPAIAPLDKFRLTHAGALYAGRRGGGALFDVLREMSDAKLITDDFELRLVGEVPAPVERIIRDHQLLDIVSWTAPLYFLPSLAEMKAGKALLVIDANFETSPFLPSKLFDYLIFDRPIIALTPPGSETDNFLKGLGYDTAPPDEPNMIKQLLLRMLGRWRSGDLKPTAAHLEARKTYDLHAVAPQYESLFEWVRHG